VENNLRGAFMEMEAPLGEMGPLIADSQRKKGGPGRCSLAGLECLKKGVITNTEEECRRSREKETLQNGERMLVGPGWLLSQLALNGVVNGRSAMRKGKERGGTGVAVTIVAEETGLYERAKVQHWRCRNDEGRVRKGKQHLVRGTSKKFCTVDAQDGKQFLKKKKMRRGRRHHVQEREARQGFRYAGGWGGQSARTA